MNSGAFDLPIMEETESVLWLLFQAYVGILKVLEALVSALGSRSRED